MSQNPENRLSLAGIGQGAAEELFQYELERVLENIADPNADYKPAREITIKLRFSPVEDRSYAPYRVNVTSKLAPTKAKGGHMFLSLEDGSVVARETTVKQLTLPGTGIGMKGNG